MQASINYGNQSCFLQTRYWNPLDFLFPDRVAMPRATDIMLSFEGGGGGWGVSVVVLGVSVVT
jgi:hypothetical protein